MMTQSKPRVLIVEDNPDLSDIARLNFEAEGFVVALSMEGMDGIVKALEFKPDVILLDLMMPQVDGFEVLSAIRTNSSMDVLIVVNSSLGEQKDIDRALALGADGYLQKSDFKPSEVVARIKELLAAKSVRFAALLR